MGCLETGEKEDGPAEGTAGRDKREGEGRTGHPGRPGRGNRRWGGKDLCLTKKKKKDPLRKSGRRRLEKRGSVQPGKAWIGG